MSKKIIIAIVGVLVIGGGLVLIMNSGDDSSNESNTSSQTSNNTVNQQTQDESTQVSGTLSSISGDGKARECTFSSSGEAGSADGKMYTDGNGRGLMTMNVQTDEGNTGQSNTLMSADKVYAWTVSGDKTFGFVYEKDQFNNNSSTTGDQNNSANPNQSFSMDCKSWTVDEAVLTPPSDVTFQSFGNLPNIPSGN